MEDIFSHTHHSGDEAPYPSAAYKDKNVILASNSPRRRELLGMILPHFTIAESRKVDETYPAGIAAEDVPVYLSNLKSEAYSDMLGNDDLIVTADTVVIADGEVLGKPADAHEAEQMLMKLSGKSHMVVTGVTLASRSGRMKDSFSETTKVTFAEISPEEAREYIARYAPFDKAGSYGIQEWIGAVAISGIDGCFYNVMGLPLHTLYVHLRNFFQEAV